MSISEKYGILAAINKSRFPTLEFEISGFFASISFKFGGRIVIYWEHNEASFISLAAFFCPLA
jgi:hypothetical protein